MKNTQNDTAKIFSDKIQKRCSKCGEYKDLEEEYYFVQGGKYPMGECKECFKDRAIKHYHIPEVKERESKRKKRFYKNNKKLCLNRNRRWDKKHKEYTKLRSNIYQYIKKIHVHLGRKIEFPREYKKYSKETLKIMRERLSNLKSIWNEFKVLAK